MKSFATNTSEPVGIAFASGRRQTGAAIIAALAAVALMAGGWLILAGFAAAAFAFVLIAIGSIAMIKGDTDKFLIGWVFLYPVGYYLLSYPRERPVIQFDRLLILCLLMGILAAGKSRIRKIPVELKRSAIAWGLFLVVTAISFLMARKVITVGRLIVDNLLLPAILGWYMVRQFRLRGNEKWLHTAICVISIYSAAIGLAEVLLQKDLLAFPQSADYFANDPTDRTQFALLRPNGPFLANQSFAIVGLISLFLLAFLWTQIRDGAGPWRRVFHYTGLVAALLEANLPVFRSIFLTLILVVIIDVFWTTGYRRTLRLAVLAVFPTTVILIGLMLPSVLEDRKSSENVSNRLSQDRQTWRIFIDHPVFGVGLMNFTPTAGSQPRYQADLDNTPPLNFPHNNLGWIAAETGMVGFVPFALSQILLVAAFWRLAKRGERGRAVWKYFVFIFLSYWITGMTETAAYFGELNMWFIFAVGLLYCHGSSEQPVGAKQTLPVVERVAV